MPKKKVIDEHNDGWKSIVGEGGQVELVQEPDEEEEPLGAEEDLEDDDLDEEEWEEEEWEDDEDDEDDEGFDDVVEPAARSTFSSYGTYKKNCIICGDEFESQRSHSRFCHKVGCRQAYNRRENAIKSSVAQIDRALDALAAQLAAEGDKDREAVKLLAAQARQALLDVEKNLVKRLDQLAPGRHPRKEITARPERVSPDELQRGDEVWAVLGQARPHRFMVYGEAADDPELIECGPVRNDRLVGGVRTLVPRSAIWLRIVDPDMP